MAVEKSLMDSLGNSQEREERSDQRAMIAGATPLLVGLLTGNTGDAVEIASKGLMAEDTRKLEEDRTLLSYLKKKQAAKTAGSNRLYKVRDESGNITYRTREEALDKTAPRPRRSEGGLERIAETRSDIAVKQSERLGKDYVKVKDPEGREMFVSKTGRETKEVFPTESTITPEFKEKRNKRYTQLSSRVKEDLDAVRTAERGLKLSSSKSVMPQMVSLNMAVKVTEQRATDEDYARVTKAVGNINKIREAIKEEKDGKVVARKIREANELFESILGVANNSLERHVKSSAEAISSTDEQYEDAMKNFGDLLPKRKRRGEVTVGDISMEDTKKEQSRLNKIKELKKRLGK